MHQSFFVNKRYIKSSLISKAVEEAYKTQVMVGKYPFLVLDIEIDASVIDVNTHPSKLEVKFSNENEIFRAVFHAVENALYSSPQIPKIEREDKNSIIDPSYIKNWKEKKEERSAASFEKTFPGQYTHEFKKTFDSTFSTEGKTVSPVLKERIPEEKKFQASKTTFYEVLSGVIEQMHRPP